MTTVWNRMAAAWRGWERFWLGPADGRVYGLLRIGFAGVAGINVLDLWPHRLAFFSDAGMIGPPPSEGAIPGVFSAIGSPAGVTAVLAVALVAAVWLAVGVAARPAALILFLWHVSYTGQGDPVLHGWDVLLRSLSFLVLISPLGPSLPEWIARGGRGSVPRYGLILVQWQLAVLYWQTVWLKVPDAAWRSGEFFSSFMMSNYSRFPAAGWAHGEVVSALLSHGTLLLEAAIPLLLWHPRTRWLGVAAGLALHGAILAVSRLLLFTLAVWVPYLAFLEGNDLDRIAAWGRSLRRRAR